MRMVVGILVALAACQAPVGVQNVQLPPDSATQCSDQCRSIGLELDSVVVMANNVGCVCRPIAAPAPAAAPGAPVSSARRSSSAGGMTAIMIAEEEERQRQANQRRTQN